MRQVVIRCAGSIDPLVQRRARQLGLDTPPGRARSQLWMGYILNAIGHAERTLVNVVEMPLFYGGLSNFVAGLDDGGAVPRLAPRYELTKPAPRGAPDSPPANNATSFGLIDGVYFAGGHWFEQERLAARSLTFNARAGVFAAAGKIVADPGRRDIISAWTLLIDEPNNSINDALREDYVQGAIPWRCQSTSLTDALSVFIFSSKARSLALYVDAGYLAHHYGSRVRWLGMPNRLRQVQGEEVFFADTGKATPSPSRYADRAADSDMGSVFPNGLPLQYTSEAPGARPQHCFPDVLRLAERLFIAAPCVAIPDGFDVIDMSGLDDSTLDQGVRRGFISARSLFFARNGDPAISHLEGDGWNCIGYGSPMLSLMHINSEKPLSKSEAQSWQAKTMWLSDSFAAGTRYPLPFKNAAPVSGASESELDPQGIVEGAPFADMEQVLFIRLTDLPGWAQPQPLTQTYALWRQSQPPSFRDGDGWFDPAIEVHSSQTLGCVFGDPKQTLIGNQLEVLWPIKARTSSLVAPITPRPADEPPLALVFQSKTGVARAIFTLDDSRQLSLSAPVDILFPDLIGPARSELMPSGAEQGTAKLPSLLWAGVLQGKRVYLLRAVRYVRDAYCGSMEQAEWPVRWTASLAAEREWPAEAGDSGLYTSIYELGDRGTAEGYGRAYSPRPDQEQIEELWLVVDGVRQIIAVPDNLLLWPVIFDGPCTYYFDRDSGAGRTPPYMYYAEGKKPWLLSGQRQSGGIVYGYNESDGYISRLHEEPLGYGATFNTVDVINEREVVLVLHGYDPNMHTKVMRLDCLNGSHQVFDAPYSRGFYSLNCYQQEIRNEQDEVVMQAHLILRSGRQGSGASAAFSIDGGQSWVERVFTEENLPAGTEMAGLGIYVHGPALDAGSKDPTSPLYYRRKPSP